MGQQVGKFPAIHTLCVPTVRLHSRGISQRGRIPSWLHLHIVGTHRSAPTQASPVWVTEPLLGTHRSARSQPQRAMRPQRTRAQPRQGTTLPSPLRGNLRDALAVELRRPQGYPPRRKGRSSDHPMVPTGCCQTTSGRGSGSVSSTHSIVRGGAR